MFKVKVNGFAEGIWLCWDNDFFVNIIYIHPQVVHVKVRSAHLTNQFFASFVYTSPHNTTRKELWPYLSSLVEMMDRPWIIIGDFNYILDGLKRVEERTLRILVVSFGIFFSKML